MKRFEELYQSKDYQGAEAYLKEVRADIGEWNYHFNMGVLKTAEANLAQARLHYLQAKKYDDGSVELATNLENLNKKLDLAVLEKPQGANDYYYQTILNIPDVLWTSLSLVVFIVGYLVIRKTFRWNQILTVALLGILPLVYFAYIKTIDTYISNTEMSIYDGPSELFVGQYQIPAGVRIIGKKRDQWLEIKYPSKFQGWIKIENNNLLEIK